MDQKNTQSQSDRSQQTVSQSSSPSVSQKKAKSMANETSTTASRRETGADIDASGSSLGAVVSERAPELIQEVVQYLENNWGLRRIEKVAAAIGIGSTMDLTKLADMAPNWETIKRKVTAKPAQTAALIVAGVGLVFIARQLLSEDISSARDEKLHH